jgi:hypothetical protein
MSHPLIHQICTNEPLSFTWNIHMSHTIIHEIHVSHPLIHEIYIWATLLYMKYIWATLLYMKYTYEPPSYTWNIHMSHPVIHEIYIWAISLIHEIYIWATLLYMKYTYEPPSYTWNIHMSHPLKHEIYIWATLLYIKYIWATLMRRYAVQAIISYTLQMKGRWEFIINVWFRFMYYQKWNCTPSLFPKQIIMFCLPISTFMYLWAIHIFQGLVCLFCCR